jgi:hypothetical protein
MTQIAIIGDGAEGLEIAKILAGKAKDRNIEIVVSNIDVNNNPFEREPFIIRAPLPLPELSNLYDKKGNILPLPKSKYHK